MFSTNLAEFRSTVSLFQDDPFLSISDDFLINMKLNSDVRDYNSAADRRAAAASLTLLKKSANECNGSLPLILLRALSRLTDVWCTIFLIVQLQAIELIWILLICQLGVDSLNKLMSECFTPDDGLLFGPKFAFNWTYTPELAHSEESLSFDEVGPMSLIFCAKYMITIGADLIGNMH